MTNLVADKIDEMFPFDEYREGQKECIEFILEAFDKGYKYVILEAPTGSGKSPIGLTVANNFGKSFYLTIQKILQSQIMDDFESMYNMVDLKGRSNYPCTLYEKMNKNIGHSKRSQEIVKANTNCNEGYCRTQYKKYKCQDCFHENNGGNLTILPPGATFSACPYYERLGQAQTSKIALMNFSSFLFQTTFAKSFSRRDLMIVDEAHNVEPQLMAFVELSLDDRILSNFGYRLPVLNEPHEYNQHFIDTELIQVLKQALVKSKDSSDIKMEDELMQLISRVFHFTRSIADGHKWVVETSKIKGFTKVTLRPVYVKNDAYKSLFAHADKVLLMSATILEPRLYARSLGIEEGTYISYRMKNKFPRENRLITYSPAIKVSGGKKQMDEWGPPLVDKLDEIMEKHHGQRGIVHTHNFYIAEYLKANCTNSARFRYQMDYPSRNTKELMLKDHAEISDSVIIAPAMHEGVDLKDDLSRFQVVCKIPWLNFFDDKQLAIRKEEDPHYYTWLTALKYMQMIGRSIRSETDYADTYVIDAGFEYFYYSAQNILPQWMKDAIIW